MAIRTIRTEGDEILRKKSKKVEVIDEKITELIQDMIETLHKYDGVGLAAVQVGILKQILIIKCFSYTMILYYKDNTTINNIKRKNKMFFLILLHTTYCVLKVCTN
jgi:peptide deformylase